MTSADFQASDCSAYNVCTTTVEITIGFLGDPALLDDIAIDSEDDRRASNP